MDRKRVFPKAHRLIVSFVVLEIERSMFRRRVSCLCSICPNLFVMVRPLFIPCSLSSCLIPSLTSSRPPGRSPTPKSLSVEGEEEQKKREEGSFFRVDRAITILLSQKLSIILAAKKKDQKSPRSQCKDGTTPFPGDLILELYTTFPPVQIILRRRAFSPARR